MLSSCNFFLCASFIFPRFQNVFVDGWNQWNQWEHWNPAGPGSGNWEWSGVPPPGVSIGPDGKPVGMANVPVAPSAPQISGNVPFNVPPPSSSSPYVYNSVSNTQSYNQVCKQINFFFNYMKNCSINGDF